ncbi:MAG: hypothetical protein JSS91_01020 [Bacteroidetes bacterium]|nr:hypothetical protein [Bacteroidota bacterium]
MKILFKSDIALSQSEYFETNNFEAVYTGDNILDFMRFPEEKNTVKGYAVIPFDVQQECFVKMNIYDRSGKLYDTIVDGYMYPGKYSVIFKTGKDLLPEEFEYRLEESGKLFVNSFLIKK